MRLLRWFNLIASGILVIYNAAAHVWPMVGMNAAIVIIDICFLFAAARLRRSEDERYRTRSTRLR
jgi:membrane protein YdbS with pleckstrin-like domain